MRRMIRVFGGAALSGVVVLGAAAPPAVAGIDGDRFQVVLRTASEHYEDVGPPGPSVGDWSTFRERLFHRGERVGQGNGACDLTRRTQRSFTFHCVVTISLRGKGQIALQGPVTFRRGERPRSDLAVTGGTGQYAGAAGSARLIERREGPTRLRVRLRG